MNDTNATVRAILDDIVPTVRRRDAETLIELMERVTGQPPRPWGSIVGFGEYHYRYASGREGDAPAAGFAPRKAATVIYLPDGIGAHTNDLARLGPHKAGVGCLYIKSLEAIDLPVLETIIENSFRTVTVDTFAKRAHEGRPAESSPETAD